MKPLFSIIISTFPGEKVANEFADMLADLKRIGQIEEEEAYNEPSIIIFDDPNQLKLDFDYGSDT